VDDKGNKEKRTLISQFVRFNIVGAVNTALTYAVYAGLVFFGVNHFIALGADYTVGIVFGYFVNKRVTFSIRGSRGIASFLRMVASYIPLLALNALFLWTLVDEVGMNKYLGQLISAAIVAVLSFVVQRTVVFNTHKKEP
jgi:putative flippase GtrA